MSFLIHAQVAFSTSRNPYFVEFIRSLRPTYSVPSPYVLSHTVLDAEYARIQLDDIESLKSRRLLTFLIDGWEDVQRRSLYGSVAAEVGKPSIMMGLENLTGQRATADRLVDVTKNALAQLEVEDPHQFIAVTTDNPTTMKAYRRKLENIWKWMLVRNTFSLVHKQYLTVTNFYKMLACFLHGLNTTIGKIISHPIAKRSISQCTRITSFFNGSHYWGGQLKKLAKEHNILSGLKTHTDSRRYSFIVQALSVLTHQCVTLFTTLTMLI